MNISKALCISIHTALLLGLFSQSEEYYDLLKIFVLVSFVFGLVIFSKRQRKKSEFARSVMTNNQLKRNWLPISLAGFFSFFLFFSFEMHSSARADSSEIEIGSHTKESKSEKIEVEVGKTKWSKVRAKRVVVVGKIIRGVGKEQEENIIGEK